jgi:hypothetical protein
MVRTLAGLAFSLFLFGLVSALGGDRAMAQCGSCTPPPPPPPCDTCTPPPCDTCTPPPCDTCAPPPCDTCQPINISINVDSSASAQAYSAANAAARSVANAHGSASAIGAGNGMGAGIGFGGGSSGPGFTTGVFSSLPDIVVVEAPAARQKRRVSYQASREKTVKVIIQAFCLDDRSEPHPASQVFPDKDVDNDYEGELYRCIAGTRMQYVVADWTAKISFDGGKSVTCDKNQALFHTRQGRLECRKQAAARDCNERSLLRRFGAGIKILTIITTETYTAYREEEVETSSSSSSSSVAGARGGYGVVTGGY